MNAHHIIRQAEHILSVLVRTALISALFLTYASTLYLRHGASLTPLHP